MNIHRNLKIRDTIGENKGVEIGTGNRTREIRVGFSAIVELIKGNNTDNEVGLKWATDVILSKLIENMEPSSPGTEEEPNEGQIIRARVRVRIVLGVVLKA